MGISCQKIAISWKPIFNSWKCSVINDMHKMVTEWWFGGKSPTRELQISPRELQIPSNKLPKAKCAIYKKTLPILTDWFPSNGNFLARNHQCLLHELYISNLKFYLQNVKFWVNSCKNQNVQPSRCCRKWENKKNIK